jgi:hypothetical protein
MGFDSRVKIPLPLVLLLGFAFLIGVFYLLSRHFSSKGFFDEEGILWLFAVGTVPGLMVAAGQYLMSWGEFAEIGRLRDIGIERALLARDDKKYYGDLLRKARLNVWVLGVTAGRFIDDFADAQSPREENSVLLGALRRKVHVRILVAMPTHLEATSVQQAERARVRFEALRKEFPDYFEFKYFDHAPNQSFVRVDQAVIVGPMLRGVESKNSPALHIRTDSPLAGPYVENFEREWNDAIIPDKVL